MSNCQKAIDRFKMFWFDTGMRYSVRNSFSTELDYGYNHRVLIEGPQFREFPNFRCYAPDHTLDYWEDVDVLVFLKSSIGIIVQRMPLVMFRLFDKYNYNDLQDYLIAVIPNQKWYYANLMSALAYYKYQMLPYPIMRYKIHKSSLFCIQVMHHDEHSMFTIPSEKYQRIREFFMRGDNVSISWKTYTGTGWDYQGRNLFPNTTLMSRTVPSFVQDSNELILTPHWMYHHSFDGPIEESILQKYEPYLKKYFSQRTVYM